MSFLNNQNSKEQLRLVISSIRVGVVSKADDDVLHVLSTIKTYSYFSFVFSFVPKKVDLLEIAKVMWLRWKSIRPCKNGREEENKFFSQLWLHPVVFLKRKCQFSCRRSGSCPLQLSDQLHYNCVRRSTWKYYQYNSGYLLVRNDN